MKPEAGPQDALPLLMEAVVGAAIGALVALVVSLVAKRRINIFQDLLLGAGGYIGGVAATPYIPWHRNTITYRVGNTIISSTTRHFQHPYRVAFVTALLLPVVFETVIYFMRKKAGSSRMPNARA